MEPGIVLVVHLYVNPGRADEFRRFETAAARIMGRYGGRIERVVRPTAGAAGAPVPDESKVCRSPISGVVVKVTAQVGQAIQANDVLLVLEAMKMETVITSPVAGKVARVNVTGGDAVQSGQVLLEFE